MSFLGAALALGGTFLGNQARSDSARMQGALYERQAQALALDNTLAKQTRTKQRDALMGAQAVGFSKAGVTLDGTALDVMGDTAAEFARDEYVADLRTRLGMDNARFSAYAAGKNANMSNIASLVGTGAQIFLRS